MTFGDSSRSTFVAERSILILVLEVITDARHSSLSVDTRLVELFWLI